MPGGEGVDMGTDEGAVVPDEVDATRCFDGAKVMEGKEPKDKSSSRPRDCDEASLTVFKLSAADMVRLWYLSIDFVGAQESNKTAGVRFWFETSG